RILALEIRDDAIEEVELATGEAAPHRERHLLLRVELLRRAAVAPATATTAAGRKPQPADHRGRDERPPPRQPPHHAHLSPPISLRAVPTAAWEQVKNLVAKRS